MWPKTKFKVTRLMKFIQLLFFKRFIRIIGSSKALETKRGYAIFRLCEAPVKGTNGFVSPVGHLYTVVNKK